MLPSLKTAFTLLSVLQLISSIPVDVNAHLHLQTLKETINLIQKGFSGVQVPCNDTRVPQVAFTNQKMEYQELLCQAHLALTKVTKCNESYKPLISNLGMLHKNKSCNLSDENEIYLRHFLPALGNFTQGLYRHLGQPTAQ